MAIRVNFAGVTLYKPGGSWISPNAMARDRLFVLLEKLQVWPRKEIPRE